MLPGCVDVTFGRVVVTTVPGFVDVVVGAVTVTVGVTVVVTSVTDGAVVRAVDGSLSSDDSSGTAGLVVGDGS